MSTSRRYVSARVSPGGPSGSDDHTTTEVDSETEMATRVAGVDGAVGIWKLKPHKICAKLHDVWVCVWFFVAFLAFQWDKFKRKRSDSRERFAELRETRR